MIRGSGSFACHTFCDLRLFDLLGKIRGIDTCCRVFGNRMVTTCVNDLGLSLLGFELRG